MVNHMFYYTEFIFYTALINSPIEEAVFTFILLKCGIEVTGITDAAK